MHQHNLVCVCAHIQIQFFGGNVFNSISDQEYGMASSLKKCGDPFKYTMRGVVTGTTATFSLSPM